MGVERSERIGCLVYLWEYSTGRTGLFFGVETGANFAGTEATNVGKTFDCVQDGVMRTLDAPYKPRPIRFLKMMDIRGWRLKVYGICHQDGPVVDEEPDGALVAMALGVVRTKLPMPPQSDERYGVGFVIVHQGQDRNWVLLDWWHDREILKQVLMSSPLDQPEKITPVKGDFLACTWELAVISFERQAWVDTVLNNPVGPDLEAYFAQQLNADL